MVGIYVNKTKLILKERLNNYDWTSKKLELNPERTFSSFSSILENIFEESFPFKKSKPNKKKSPIKPWFTPAMLNSTNQIEKLTKKINMNPILINIANFKAYNAVNRSLVKKAKCNIFSR